MNLNALNQAMVRTTTDFERQTRTVRRKPRVAFNQVWKASQATPLRPDPTKGRLLDTQV